jgi:hypothetical protein
MGAPAGKSPRRIRVTNGSKKGGQGESTRKSLPVGKLLEEWRKRGKLPRRDSNPLRRAGREDRSPPAWHSSRSSASGRIRLHSPGLSLRVAGFLVADENGSCVVAGS